MQVIEVTEWDQIEALERMIFSLSTAIDGLDDNDLIARLQRDMACLILLREEIKDDIGTFNDQKLPN